MGKARLAGKEKARLAGKEKTSQAKRSQPESTPRFPKVSMKRTLNVTELEPHQIYISPQFLTASECQAFIAYFEAHLPPQPAPAITKPGNAFRSNDRQSIHSPELATLLWQSGMDQMCDHDGIATVSLPRTPVGLNSNIRVYRYRPGQRFEGHYDDAVQDRETGLWTAWTLLIYLNGDMQGGETVFHKEISKKRTDSITVKPEQGLALLHRHGTHCLFHEALEVTSGAKWVLRSDVLIGPSSARNTSQ